MAPFSQEMHNVQISAIHCPRDFNDNADLMNAVFTAGQDGIIKIWDRRQKQNVTSLASATAGFGSAPFFSVTTNKNMIVGGTNEDILLWDVKKLQKPIGRFSECHNSDVTQLKFNSNGQILISCSVDNVISMFDFNNHDGGKRLKEDELIDGAYSSTQPLVDCGFITDDIIWTQTTINTIEIIRLEDAICIMTIDQVSFLSTNTSNNRI